MTLKEIIRQDLANAQRKRAGLQLSTLRLLEAAIKNKEIEKRANLAIRSKGLNGQDLEEKSQLSDEEIYKILSSEIKKRKEAALVYEKGGRLDLAEKEKKEVEFLMRYMPEQLNEEEIKKVVAQVIKEQGASSVKDMGRVMSCVMARIGGRADGGQVARIVKEILD